MNVLRLAPGTPEPLGVTLHGDGINIAVLAPNATAIELCLFDPSGTTELRRVRLPHRSAGIHHAHIAPIPPGTRYGLRAHGPWAPEQDHRFNPARLLVDPWATALDRVPRLHPTMFDSAGDADSGPFVPKAIVTATAADTVPKSITPWDRTVIYELHVRGFTIGHPGIPSELRGRFAGLGHPAAIAHLTGLGVTAVELMPPAAWIDEPHLVRLGLSNHWGYNTIAPLAPDPRLAPGGWPEVRAAVAALAAAGIETLVDMAPNHTGEGDLSGPTLSLRGLDHAAYYRLAGGQPVDDTGCGNTLALDQPPALRLAMDSLRAWVRFGGVHGFRFDLAVAMGRRAEGFDAAAPLLQAIAQDPVLAPCKLIAEPWDLGPGGYRLGGFPAGWAEWNDRFRDDIRRFWRGDPARRGPLATRLAGSADIFAPKGTPTRSINFVTAHDGFTLADLTAYTAKRNQPNGEDNRDGTDANHAWNHGTEGPSDDPAIRAARLADQRALLALVLFARGTPMLAMGSELGHTQHGNNNAYAQDNPTAWLDWNAAAPGLADWTARLIRLRAAHPALRADHFLAGGPEWDPDVAWLDETGRPLDAAAWNAPAGNLLVMLLDGRLALVANRGPAATVALPGPRWRRLADSAAPDAPVAHQGPTITVAASSVVLLEADPAARATGSDALLARLATAAGIAPEWWEVSGTRHAVSPETTRALLAAMRLPTGTRGEARDSLAALAERRDRADLPPALVGRLGAAITLALPLEPGCDPAPLWLAITAEDGAITRLRATGPVQERIALDDRPLRRWRIAMPDLPPGRYQLTRDDRPDRSCGLVVAPPACHLPPALAGQRRFGIAAQLYTLRRDGDQGIGDFTTLRDLALATARAGGAAVALNPLHALFQRDRGRASPYHPNDRRFLDPIYIDTCEPGPPSGDFVDYPAVWTRKRAALARAFATLPEHAPDLDAFIAQGGAALAGFLAHESGDDPAERRFQAWMQMLADRQLAAASAAATEGGLELGLIRDLAVGAAPDGSEARAHAHLLAHGVSIGAPPDPFAPQGQVWALPPPDPTRMAENGYAAFASLLRANLRHAGGLRIDHVMGLSRLFWVPEGAAGADGAYVAYPFDDLLGILALESHRARAVIIGEDLGTVPEGFRDRLEAQNILGCRVLLLDPAETPPPRSVASLTTHDLPTFAGWRAGTDIAERHALGLAADTEEDRATQAAHVTLLTAEAAHAHLAAGPACLVLAQADDLAGETVAVNLPGTDTERPNWRRRLAPTIPRLFTQAEPVLASLRTGRVPRPG